MLKIRRPIRVFNLCSAQLRSFTLGLCYNLNRPVEDKVMVEELITEKGSFAKAFEKFAYHKDDYLETSGVSFINLLRNSKFIDLGDTEEKVVIGTIFHVVEDDLYLDFGWKFHCVVSRPWKNGHEYVRGAKVRLSLKDLELSTRFLGSHKDLTLLESDATLIGLLSTPVRSRDTGDSIS